MDLIIYCEDEAAFTFDLLKVAPSLVQNAASEIPEILLDKSITIRNSAETIWLVRDDGNIMSLAEDLKSLIVLGTYDQVFNNPDKLEIYNRVYDQTPIYILDPDGNNTMYVPAQKFCVFAD